MLFDKEIYTLLIAWLDEGISERVSYNNEQNMSNWTKRLILIHVINGMNAFNWKLNFISQE